MVCLYWVGHLGVTSAHFTLTACLGLWLLANVQVDCVKCSPYSGYVNHHMVRHSLPVDALIQTWTIHVCVSQTLV